MNESYWILSSNYRTYDKLREDIVTKYLIVGAGIVGVTTAYLLAKEGLEVVLVDANKVGYGSSGRNTGKVSTQHGAIYSKIEKKHGIDTAYTYYELNNNALNMIEDIIKENNINCDFERKTSYVFTQSNEYINDLKYEYNLCKKIGIDCEYYDSLDLPIEIKGALGFKNQAQFNPKKYLDKLASVCSNMGVKIYENTPIKDIENGKICTLKTQEDITIKAQTVIMASHFPWYDAKNLYFAKEKGERSYLIGASYNSEIQDGMFISIEKPVKTFKVHKDENKRLLIIGGHNHKVGKGGVESEIYGDIESYAREKFNIGDVCYKWSSQDYISYDNLPYIGYINKNQDNIYVATGFNKWGMTNGTASAMIIKDMIVNNFSKYEDIFNPSRKQNYFNKEFIKENMNVGMDYISGKFKIGSDDMPSEKGEGKIVTLDGKRYGGYRHYNQELYIVDITCTHLGCELKFNSAEKTWDCPCHASRFDYEGNILEGPALRPLNRYGEDKNKVNPILK